MNRLADLVHQYQVAELEEQRQAIAEEIIRAVAPEMEGFIRRSCRSEIVEDVQQETLLGIVRGLGSFKGQTDAEFWRYCNQIARRRIVDHLRSRKHRPLAGADSEYLWKVVEATAQDEPLSLAERLDLKNAMQLLLKAKPPCYELLWDRYILGWEHAEIGIALGLTPGAARTRVRRCLELAHALVKKGE
jgi:RNA polymerase sigma factor (sigma-70 family)